MSIEVSKQYIGKDGEVVEARGIKSIDTLKLTLADSGNIVFFSTLTPLFQHVLTERDFLEQYKPCKPVYEWQWAVEEVNGIRITEYYTEDEEIKLNCYTTGKQRLDFTKRERKQQSNKISL